MNETVRVTGATLLSAEEAEKLPDHLREYDGWWWLRSPGKIQYNAAGVYSSGSVDCGGGSTDHAHGCVRPALRISNLESSNLRVGDRFEFGGVEFEVVSDNLAFCVTDIGCCAFRKDWEVDDANDYEASDVKRFVDGWFQKASADKETSQKEKTPTSPAQEKNKRRKAMRIKRCVEVEVDIPIDVTGATLLSTEEARNLPDRLRKYKRWWWLRSSGYNQSAAAYVLSDGSVYYVDDDVDTDSGCVRPALRISHLESSDLQIGDRFEFGNVEFEVVSNDLAFCVTDIGRCAFREDWDADDANDYEASDVKKFVDEWFRRAISNQD